MRTEYRPRSDMADLEQRVPGAVAALRALTLAVDQTGLDKAFTELLKVRASQINGCAFCRQFHINMARKLGVTAAQLDQVEDWRDAEPAVFSERERAALAWTENLTLMAEQPVTDAAFADLQTQFSATEIAALTTAIATINAWNRIAGALAFAPPPPV